MKDKIKRYDYVFYATCTCGSHKTDYVSIHGSLVESRYNYQISIIIAKKKVFLDLQHEQRY